MPRAFALRSSNAFSILPIAFWITEPGLWRVARYRSQTMRSTERATADDVRRQILDDARKTPRRAVRIGDLRPADRAVVRGCLEKDPRTPASVARERLE